MAEILIRKLLTEAVQTGGTYADFTVSDGKVAFTCDGGTRRSTRNYRRTKNEIKEDEKVLKQLTDRNLLFTAQLTRVSFTLSDKRTAVFTRQDDDSHCVITARRVTETREKVSEYVRFFSDHAFTVGIAFALKKQRNGREQISPCEGEILNGINSTGIPTDLYFVVSGNFHAGKGFSETLVLPTMPESNF